MKSLTFIYRDHHWFHRSGLGVVSFFCFGALLGPTGCEDEAGNPDEARAPLDEPIGASTGAARAFEPSFPEGLPLDAGTDPSSTSSVESSATSGLSTASVGMTTTSIGESTGSSDAETGSGEASSTTTTEPGDSSTLGEDTSFAPQDSSLGADTSSSGDTTSKDDDTSSDDDTSAPDEAVEVDPLGPRYGLRLDLNLEGPVDPGVTYRALVFHFEAQAPQSPTDPVWPALNQVETWSQGQPRLMFNAQGRAGLVLPTPGIDQVDASSGRSKLHGIAVYEDINSDGLWSDDEPFIAASPRVLSYQTGTDERPESWGYPATWKDLVDPSEARYVELDFESPSLVLRRFDRHRAPGELRGKYEYIPPTLSFVTMVSTLEMQDLSANFSSVSRPADLALREKVDPDPMWTLRAQGAVPVERRQSELITIPGIRPAYVSTQWIVGYQRPVGAPVQVPGEFLTRDSTLVSAACWKNYEVLGVRLDEGAWASSPEGALYAAWLSLGVGWGFVPISVEEAPSYQVRLDEIPEQGVPNTSFTCGHLLSR